MDYVKSAVKKMKSKRKLLTVLLIIICFLFVGCEQKNNRDNSKYSIISTNFPGYDFARAIVGEESDFNIRMLVKPGSEVHHFEPTPQDIIDIQNSDLFIYVGGESDSWVDDILNDIDISRVKIVKLMDLVDVLQEEKVDGMQIEDNDLEDDEHIWTSPKNAISIVDKLEDFIIEIDKFNKEKYEENTKNYISKLNDLDLQIKEVVNTSKRKEIIVGDRFPLRYFTELYGIKYYAAFPGCSDQTEASAKTIAFLIDKVKKDNIPVIFTIELSSGKIAQTIAKETGAKVLLFHSAHNVSYKDFSNNITYLDIMKNNLSNLKEALN